MSERLRDAFAAAVRRSQEAFSAGDYEAAFAEVDPDIEWHSGDWVLEREVIRGRAALVEFFRRGSDAGSWEVVAEQVSELRPGLFLVHQRGTSTGRTSRIVGEMDFFQLYELGPNGVTRVREYRTREEAVAAAEAG